MKVTETTMLIRKLEASEGMVLTDIKTERLRRKVICLGVGDSEDNYKRD